MRATGCSRRVLIISLNLRGISKAAHWCDAKRMLRCKSADGSKQLETSAHRENGIDQEKSSRMERAGSGDGDPRQQRPSYVLFLPHLILT